MTVIAQATSSIQIGHGVTQVGTWHPVMIANGTATINELSNGRAFIGLGSGGNALLTMEAGPPTVARSARSGCVLQGIHGGRGRRVAGAQDALGVGPGSVPIVMGCTGPKSSMLGGEIADAVISIGCDPIVHDWRRRLLRERCRAGRPQPRFSDLWVRGIMYVADTKEEARREVASYTATAARDFYFSIFRHASDEAKELGAAIEAKYPGCSTRSRRCGPTSTHYQHEATDASHNQFVTQRMIDFFNLTGTGRRDRRAHRRDAQCRYTDDLDGSVHHDRQDGDDPQDRGADHSEVLSRLVVCL